MVEKIKELAAYGFFGVCSTAVNIIMYWICAHPMQLSTVVSTVIAWIVAVAFAYVTNRIWVFHSRSSGIKAVIREAASFFACRLLTGVIDLFCMWFFVDIQHLNDVWVKTASNILVIILNYVASKVLIFRNQI